VKLNTQSRTWLFTASIWVLVLNTLFYALWRRAATQLPPCGAKAIGVEIGLIFSLLSFVLSMFGKGLMRWVLAILTFAASYFWFSWITWIGQMQC
jgi:uncharacterized membrane protein